MNLCSQGWLKLSGNHVSTLIPKPTVTMKKGSGQGLINFKMFRLKMEMLSELMIRNLSYSIQILFTGKVNFRKVVICSEIWNMFAVLHGKI